MLASYAKTLYQAISNGALIQIADVVSKDIKQFALDSRDFDEDMRREMETALRASFDAICAILESRRVVVSDHVIISEYY